MKRRKFIQTLGAGGLVAGGVAACSKPADAPAIVTSKTQRFEWKMYTTWPRNFPGLGTGAANLASYITEMSGGRLKVRVYGAGERVPPFEVFDAVSRGSAEMGHCAAYYWKGKAAAAPFFTSVPFGLNAQEMNGWLYYGGGMELWRELYANFDLVPFEAGNTGVQMGGWFRKEINEIGDLKGLKMRIPGLGGEAMARVGVTTVNIAGSDLFTSLQNGTIDATEWVGPYNDLAFGLHQAASYYYFPGWHEPGPTLEAIVNRQAWNSLPEDLQAIVSHAAKATGMTMLSEYTARNQQALETLVNEHQVQLRKFPEPVISALREASQQVLAELTDSDPFAKKVWDSYRAFQKQVATYHRLTERAYYDARDPLP